MPRLSAASDQITLLSSPPIGTLPSRQMERLLEDVALCGEQLALLLQDMAAAVPPGWADPSTVERMAAFAGGRVSYGPRMLSLLTMLRRAQSWLEAIDYETGATITLPGFAPGQPSLEQQLTGL